MDEDRDPSLPTGVGDSVPEEFQQIWLSNELMERVKEVAHDIGERVSHVLRGAEEPDKS
jgi:hypothetical protein